MSGSWRAGSMFLLFKQKTAYEMRISDWSSDVCSSDLGTLAYWSQPSPENEAAATAHLTFEGTRDQYLADVPPDVAARIPAESWEEDWRVMCLPGRMDTQRALLADSANYVARFDSIAEYLARWQTASLMLVGRHDAFFTLPEVLSW